MNKFKEPIVEKPAVEKSDKPVKYNKIVRSALNLFSGNFLSKDYVILQIPFILFLTMFGLIYIANGYYAEKSIREISRITSELKELKSEFITNKSELMFMSNQSQVAHAAATLGLKESVTPPKKIIVQENGPIQTKTKN